MKLLRYGRPVTTIFDLLGAKEDDMTYSLGYVASRSPEFAARLVEAVAGTRPGRLGEAVIQLQQVAREERGRTDVEILVPGEFFGVLEAKRGPALPTLDQLTRYVPVLRRRDVPVRRLVAVTNAPAHHAARVLPAEIDGIPVRHLAWREVRQLAEQARAAETNHNKRLLDEFTTYLKGLLGMEVSRSNLVYVVSIGPGSVWGLNFRSVVENDARYFYPTEGGGWPEPPNYIAFRYDARLQSIHHVEGHEIFTNPREVFPAAEDVAVPPNYCLKLGAPIKPAREVRNGPKILRSMRVWCEIDTLLTSETISAAHAETKRRLHGESPTGDDEGA